MAHALVVGGSVAGLASALTLARSGHHVTVLERDRLPQPSDHLDLDAAFAAERRGAPQAHQTHGFLARLVVELRRSLPDVLDALMAAGCRTMPTTKNLGEPQPSDDDLRVLVVRRTTYEAVLRQAAFGEKNICVRTGVGVRGVVAATSPPSAPAATGVVLDDAEGTVVRADAVVIADGRRSPLPDWLAPHGRAPRAHP